MRLAVTIIVLILIAALWLREALLAGQGVRAGLNRGLVYQRFRRRTKVSLLFIYLFLLLIFMPRIEALLGLEGDPMAAFRYGVLLYGMAFILVIWILILAMRDLRQTAEESLLQRQEIALETLKGIERVVRGSEDTSPGDSQPIHPGVTSAKPEEKNRNAAKGEKDE